MEPVVVRGLSIGTGRPKIIVPVLGETLEQLLAEAEQVKSVPADLAEWRLDWYGDVEDTAKLLAAAKALRETLGELPILATFRTAKEGGHRPVTDESYARMIRTLAESGLVDLMDIEAFTGDELVGELVDFCHRQGVKVVLSNHDFDKTPPEKELVARLCKMEALGADLSKIAVMPRSPEDVLTLLSATRARSRVSARPVVTMSMGALGAVSRLAGEVFGSALTFGSAARASAPGQVEAGKLARVLELLAIHTAENENA